MSNSGQGTIFPTQVNSRRTFQQPARYSGRDVARWMALEEK
jgi:hypothetical protein